MKMMKTLRFTVSGKPRGAARPRFMRTGHAYIPREDRDYRVKVVACARKAMLATGYVPDNSRVSATIIARFKLTPSWTKAKKTAAMEQRFSPGKPDADNIAKIILDSLNGLAYDDDKVVAQLTVRKEFAEADSVEVFISGDQSDRTGA